MKNEHSSDGIAEDIIRSFVQIGCAEIHAKTLREKYVAQLENGIVDVEDAEAVGAMVAKVEEIETEINELAQTRRRSMLCLYSMYENENSNKDFWCQVKHLGIASMTLFEAYQASEKDLELLDLSYEVNKQFIKALTQFLGVEIMDCASCFQDFLKGKENNIE